MGTTIKEYARSRGISHEAVRRQLVRYSEELKGHITQQGRSKYLDDKAVEFLDQHRLPKTIIMEPTDEETRQEVDDLKLQIDMLKDQITSLQGTIIQLQAKENVLIESNTRNALLLEVKEKEADTLQARLEESQRKSAEMETRATLAENRLEEAEKEANSYTKSWFGFYRKSK